MEIIEMIIDFDYVGQRLDKFLSVYFEEYSRGQIQSMIKEGLVLVNQKVVKNSYKLEINDNIKITKPENVDLDIEPQNLNLNIVYEDEDVIVVDKESGVIVHPSLNIVKDTLVNGLLYHCKDLSGINGVNRPGIVHRIDKDTSGLLMVAKNNKAHLSLSKQLQDKSVERNYIALVHGVIPHDYGKIDAPIGRNPNNRQNMIVTKHNAKEAYTNFSVLERFDKHTLIECRLETGRTHQIRVHMKYIGFPVVGDPKYGHKKEKDDFGQYLHARLLGFEHPTTGEYLDFTSKLPDVFEEKLKELRK
jgi:pseudouridine synthase, RluA family